MTDYKGELAMVCGTAVVIVCILAGYDETMAKAVVGFFFGAGGYIICRKKAD